MSYDIDRIDNPHEGCIDREKVREVLQRVKDIMDSPRFQTSEPVKIQGIPPIKWIEEELGL